MAKEEGEQRHQFNATKFPKQLNLNPPEQVVVMMKHRAEQTGRLFSEIVTDIISRSMNR